MSMRWEEKGMETWEQGAQPRGSGAGSWRHAVLGCYEFEVRIISLTVLVPRLDGCPPPPEQSELASLGTVFPKEEAEL